MSKDKKLMRTVAAPALALTGLAGLMAVPEAGDALWSVKLVASKAVAVAALWGWAAIMDTTDKRKGGER